MSVGKGSTGNVIAALASFFIPGRPVDPGRPLRALVFFVSAAPLAHLDGLDHAPLVHPRRRVVEAVIPS
jgi:hypothetical protein